MNKKHELVGIAWFAVAVFLLFALIIGLFFGSDMGLAGNAIKDAFFYVFGYASFLVPIIFAFLGYNKFKNEETKKPVLKITGAIMFLFSSCLLLYLLDLYESDSFAKRIPENMLGYLLGISLSGLISLFGAWLVCIIAFIFSLYFLELEHFPVKIIMLLKEQYFKLQDSFKNNVKEKNTLTGRPKREVPEVNPAKEKKPHEPVRIDAMRNAPPVKRTEKKVVKDDKQGVLPNLNVKEYSLPPLDLLEEYEPLNKMSKEDFKENEKIIKDTLANFGITITPLQTVMGPVVTRYEISVAAGQKVNKIVSLSNDLAMALSATHLRIIAPIPGQNAVGIEVPNAKYSTVSLKSIINSNEFNEPSLRLPVSIGKSVDGKCIVGDLSEMPHLLVAGATGSGKSVCLNSIIVSLLYKFTPNELKLLLIDPKRVEFTLYGNIPHLYAPVITDVRKASDALKRLCKDMVERYDTLSKANARDIISYNKKAEIKLPYIVVVIDELADIMLLAAREVEDSITRLAQLARGVGIHLVFATQRPSVDVITGVIKANFPSRIALQVFSKTDSRVILDTGGAEELLGKGDMLYYLASFPKPVRTQCSYVSTNEIKELIEFWNRQGIPEFSPMETIADAGMMEGDSEDNELFLNAIKFVKERKRASVQLLQGAFHISGGRATNLISLMESKGLIGPGIGNKPREIYFDKIDDIISSRQKP